MRRITPETRRVLRRPLGRVFSGRCPARGLRKGGLLVAVGDFCSYRLIQCGQNPDVIVYDHMCMRKPVSQRIRGVIDGYGRRRARVANPPGSITDMLADEVKGALARGRGKILVAGEEDLASLVVLMHAKDGDVLAYGQPKKGMVLVEVDAKMRRKARAIFKKMKKE